MPNSTIGWAIIIIVGIPLSITLEALSELIFSEKIGKKISGKRLSGIRIFLALIFAIVIFAALGLLSWFFMPYMDNYFS